MVIHQLVVNSFNKILPRLKANSVESANLRASSFVLYLLSTSCVLTLASSLLFPLGYATAAQFLPTRGSSSSATGLRGLLGVRLPVDVPVAPCSASESFYRILYFASAVSDIFVINVINIIRISIYYVLFVICAVIYSSFYCIYV